MSNQVIQWDEVGQIISCNRLTLLYGPPGTGKTYVAVRGGDPDAVYNCTLTDETPAAELRGHFIPQGTEWHFHMGPAIRAYVEGARLVLNEIDKASADALDFLHALLDDRDMPGMVLPTGETVNAHPDFTVVATMNGVPSDLPDAIRDRFAVAIEITAPAPGALEMLPEDLRGPASAPDPAIERTASLRAWLTYASLRESVGPDVAARAVFGVRAADVTDALRLADAR